MNSCYIVKKNIVIYIFNRMVVLLFKWKINKYSEFRKVCECDGRFSMIGGLGILS